MPILEALGAVSQAIEVAKGMRAVEKSFDVATYKMQIAELMTALSDARMELVAAREAALERDAEFDRLHEALAGQANLIEARGGFKYRAGEDGRPAGLPACPTCEQRDGRQTFTVQDGNARSVRCPVCDARFTGVAIYLQPAANEPRTLDQLQAEERSKAMREIGRRLNGP